MTKPAKNTTCIWDDGDAEGSAWVYAAKFCVGPGLPDTGLGPRDVGSPYTQSRSHAADRSARFRNYAGLRSFGLCNQMSYEMTASEPTAVMVAFYERRTNEHIERVRKCLTTMASVTDYAGELQRRSLLHDASKFGPEERIPYIWLTEFHRCRRTGEPFFYPHGMEEQVRAAISHHVTTNRHHPEFHADPNDMSEVDLIEMVCDWTAMSQEFGQDSGSARGWADKTIGHRVIFNEDRRKFVYRMIELLDSSQASNRK